jgi:nitrile hydratase
MNGVHDMGGMHGMGPVVIEKNEPVFHEAWEGRALALRLASTFHRRWDTNMYRYAIERMPPAAYHAASYYERALFGFETLLVEQKLVTAKELETGRAEGKAGVAGTLPPAGVDALLRTRNRARLDNNVPPRFRARNIHPIGHTRLPRYARGRRGVIDRDYGVFVFPDTRAMSRDPKPQHLYGVRFAARELWGPAASARDSVYMSLWDDHLDPA